MRTHYLALASAALLCLLLATPAAALELDEAKSAGAVGERVDGYVGAVSASPPASVQALVESVNAARRKAYTEISASRGVSLADVAAQAGAKLVSRTPAGEWVYDSTGQWKQK